jgi:maltose O-acetyltransferase
MSPMNFIEKSISIILQRRRKKYLNALIAKGLKMGRNVQIVDTFFFDPSHCFLISIGDNSIICPNVRLIAHDASTKMILGYTKIGLITIKENCFIGDSAIVLPNVTIGPNSIIGSGSVVTKNVPPDSVAAGNPAKVICSMDEYISKIEIISKKKTVFGHDYYLDNMDESKRRELISSIGQSIGFIV